MVDLGGRKRQIYAPYKSGRFGPWQNLSLRRLWTHFLAYISVLSIFFIRPSMFGDVYSQLASIMMFLIAAATFATAKRFKLPQNAELFRSALIILIWTYLFFITGIVGLGRAADVVNGLVMHLSVCALLFALVSSEQILESFARAYYRCFVLLALSGMITFSITSIFDTSTSLVTSFDHGTARPMEIHFPFSTIYHYTWTGDGFLARQSFWFREAGIAPAFFAFAIAIGERLKTSLKSQLALFGGLILAFSTTMLPIAVLLFFIMCASRMNFGSFERTLLFLVGGVTATIVLVYAPIIGVMDKIELALISIQARTDALRQSTQQIWQLTFGLGLHRDAGQNSDITLLAAVDSIGIAGFFLFILFYISPFFDTRSSIKEKIMIVPACLFLVLFAQPMFMAAGFAFLILFPVWRIPRQGSLR